MTFERKIVVGLDDIKAITFECAKCKTRTTVPADSLREIPGACNSCNAIWLIKDMPTYVSTSGPAPIALIQAIGRMRILIQESKETFRILLEFEEPKP